MKSAYLCFRLFLFGPFILSLSSPVCWAQSETDQPGNLAELTSGFETLAPGPLVEGSDKSGTWSADAGHAEIHTTHQRGGKASLRLLGGVERSVVWTPHDFAGDADRLEFWYERWTSRPPFSFHVELLSDGEWTSVFHDAGKAEVGSFKNHVSIPLKGKLPEQVRFRSTTSPASGVMIDDFYLGGVVPKVVKSISARQFVVPVLLRNEWNPILQIEIDVQGTEGELTLEAVQIELVGSLDIESIEKVEIIASETPQPAWFTISDIAKMAGVQVIGVSTRPQASMEVGVQTELARGANYFFVSVKLKDITDVSQNLQIACPTVKISGETRSLSPPRQEAPLRIGHALRRAGEKGVHTYRIPGLATTKQGSLIAVYDVRYRGSGDLPADIDVGMSRSVDGGRSWEPMRIIMDMGSDPQWKYDGIGDPAVLVDARTGTIWVAALWSHGNRAWHYSRQGLAPEETGQLMLVRSVDDGKTWSKPVSITQQIKNPDWNLAFNGPGKGITMKDGTLVFPAQFQDENRIPHSTIIYSVDHGATWKIGTGAHPETTEAQVIEIRPGQLMLNCRYNDASSRVVMITSDLGKTWQEHSTSKNALIEPVACMASLIDVDQELGEHTGGWLLFSNPNNLSSRQSITIKASNDLGQSWPEKYQLLLDEGRSAGYSCLTMIDQETVGILYEGSTSKLVFQRIPLRDVIGKFSEAHAKP